MIDLLGINPVKTVLSSKLKLAKMTETISSEKKSHNSNNEKKATNPIKIIHKNQLLFKMKKIK